MNKMARQDKTKTASESGAAASKRKCLLVLGMHRSGTSALTRVLSLAGAVLPKRLLGASDGSNATGHWEPDALVQYHDKLLAELGSSWDDWQSLNLGALPVRRREDIMREISDIIRTDYGEEELIVLKEPRICRFAPFFMDILRAMDVEPLPVLIFRNPLEVMDSLQKRDGMSRAQAALLWLRHVLETEQATRGMERVFSTYAGVLADWRGEFRRVADTFALDDLHKDDEVALIVEEFLSPDLRHSIRKTEDVRLDPLLAGWIAEAWEAFQVLVSKPDSPKAQARLDRVARGFEESAPVLAGYIAEVKQERDGAIANLQGLIEAKEVELTTKAQEVEQVQSLLVQSEQALQGKTSEAAAHENERVRLVGELEDKVAKLAVLEGERDELAGRVAKIQSALEQAKEKRHALRNRLGEQIGQLKKQLEEKGAALAQESARLKQMRAELEELRTSEENLTSRLEEAESQVEALSKAVEDGRARVNEHEASLSGVRQLHQVVEAGLIAEKQGREALVVEVQERAAALERQLAEASQYAQSMEQMYRSSTSWRITSPMRSVGEWFFKRSIGKKKT